jgi:hypothetical protein
MKPDKTLREHCREIGALGGASKSEKKAEAARRNASKPRPKARELNALRRAKKVQQIASQARLGSYS